MSYAVEIENLTKTFKMGESDIDVLKEINLKIDDGEFVSLMGQSGSGKSTLLYLLGGLEPPTSGNIKIQDIELSLMNDDKLSIIRRRRIGIIFQFYNLIPNMTVEENVLLPILLDGKKTKDYSEKLNEMLEVVGLSDRRLHTPKELSGGQQQRAAIARALMNDPSIVLADEPTGNLDSKAGEEILELLKKINSEQGKTIVMVTHSENAAKCGNRIIRLKDGYIDLGEQK